MMIVRNDFSGYSLRIAQAADLYAGWESDPCPDMNDDEELRRMRRRIQYPILFQGWAAAVVGDDFMEA